MLPLNPKIFEDTRIYDYEKLSILKDVLYQLCNDIENYSPDITCGDIPDYLKAWWQEHRSEYLNKGLKADRYQKYLELKKEFEQ